MTEPLLTVADVAELFGVRTRFVYRLVDERRIPFIKVGRYLRFDPADVEAYIAEQRTDVATRWPRY